MDLLGRLTLLVLLLTASALIDWLHAGERATRWREYAFLLFTATLGGAFGAAVDQVSLAISPEHFTVGKGLGGGATLRFEVTALGFHAGFLAGAVTAGVRLIANTPWANRRALRYPTLLRLMRWPILAAVILAVPGALWLDFRPAEGSSTPSIARMFMVRGLHTGLYLGAAAGLVRAVLEVRRARRRVS